MLLVFTKSILINAVARIHKRIVLDLMFMFIFIFNLIIYFLFQLIWVNKITKIFHKIYLLPKAQFDDRKGRVTEERRHRIARKMVEVFRLPMDRR